MIVVFSLMRRRGDVPLEQFQRHWLDPHGPLVCQFARLRRYSQNHVIAPGGVMPVDGFAELAYDSDADQEAATGSPEMAACDRDSPLFIGSVLRVVTEDRVILRRPAQEAAAAKQITVFTGPAASIAPVLTRYRAAARGITDLLGLVENIALRQRGPQSKVPVLDVTVAAIVELWFADEAARRRAMVALDRIADAPSYAVTEYRLL
ncbi:MAG TPA: EthD family reductase [Acetobacteraceae bacterium]|jgi:uncharacterized protein (TIGR02118 family)|nr:EthD family reductase [Acetobacteraceae bacterium]